MTSITNRLGPALQQDRTMRYISDAKSAVAEATDAAMTGLSVNDPSDAPHLWPEIYGLEDGVRDQSQYMENSDSAKMLLSTVDTTLAEATNVVTKIDGDPTHSNLKNCRKELAALFATVVYRLYYKSNST